MYPNDKLKKFWDYLEFYPEEDEEGFDGIHYGGIKGVKKDTPLEIKKLFDEYKREIDDKEVKL